MKKNNFIFCFIFCSCLISQDVQYRQELLVNSFTGGEQSNPAVTGLFGGGFVTCWQSNGQDGSLYGIYSQMFDAGGSRKGNEFLVNSITLGTQWNPALALLSDGGFVVCWQSGDNINFEYDVYGQLFDAKGSRKGQGFLVNTYTEDKQCNPAVAGLSGGGFVVCWESAYQDGSSWGVYGQLFDARGSKKGQEFLVTTYTEDNQWYPAVAGLSGGGFVVCWKNRFKYPVCGQLFDAEGSRKGKECVVSLDAAYSEWCPAVAGLSGGGFVICWDRWNKFIFRQEVLGQLYDSGGSKKDQEFLVTTYTESYQYYSTGLYPVVAGLSGGGFVVCGLGQIKKNQEIDVYGQLFDSGGSKLGLEFRVNTDTTTVNGYPVVAAIPSVGFVVGWHSQKEYSSFGDWNIYAKCFSETPISHQLISFSLTEPLMDVALQTTHVQFKWRQPSVQIVCYPWELHYKILIDESPDFISPQKFEQDMDTTFTMQGLMPGTTYFWKVLAKNIDGDSLWSTNTNAFFVSHTAAVNEKGVSPEGFLLNPNYPNPFNAETVIRFELAGAGFVRMVIYDLRGRLVRILLDDPKAAGSHSVKWDGNDRDGNALPSGIYICEIEVRTPKGRNVSKSVKMGLVK